MTAPKGSGRLSGRSAVITGASRGIGRAIAMRYAEEGADLFLTASHRACSRKRGHWPRHRARRSRCTAPT